MDIKCAGCLRNTPIVEVKKIGKKYYCELCSTYIINTLNNQNMTKPDVDI